MTRFMTCACSGTVRVADSPVVPSLNVKLDQIRKRGIIDQAIVLHRCDQGHHTAFEH
jgi:hypothetical protein